MALVFTVGSRLFGKNIGYLVGFGFYWLFWCILTPLLLCGRLGFLDLFAARIALFTKRNWLAALLWLTIVLVATIMYGLDFAKASLVLILVSVPVAVFNGICEEVLWRGLFVARFAHNPWLSIVYPAVAFAAWHFCPQLLFPAKNVVGFVLSTLLLGLSYGFIAFRTGSAKWTAISHSIGGVLALGSPIAQMLLSLGTLR